jgi:hypothetical protein
VTQDLVVIEDDCGTSNGTVMKALVEGGEVIEALRDRILGRVAATDIVNPETRKPCTKPAPCWTKTWWKRSNAGHRRSEGPYPADLRHPLRPVRQCCRDLGRGCWSTPAKPSVWWQRSRSVSRVPS